jgi:MarR-like DNA-binding transcriptional regulator SgrR of sgrS sRNA
MSETETYAKAAAQTQQQLQQAERSAGATQGLAAGYSPPPAAPTADSVIDYLLVRYGAKLEQHHHLVCRVWQLDAVCNNHLRARQEMGDVIAQLRGENSVLRNQVEAERTERLAAEIVRGVAENERNELLDRCKKLQEQLACTKPVVQAIYSWRGRAMSRELRITAVQALGDGKVRIQVDLRGVSRVGAN